MLYYHRIAESLLTQYLQLFPVVGIVGPHQSGKSTLLKHELGKKYQYVTFDDRMQIDLFYEDPKRFMNQYNHAVIFDEVQKLPEIFDAIKIAVDNDRDNYGKYILTGSSQFSFMQNITESLAGRMGLINLLPFQYREIPKSLRTQAIFSGSYPELINRQYAAKEAWYANYLTTYLEKDVRALSQIGNLRDFSRFISLLAANTSQLLNLSHYAKDLGIAVSTIKRWISILEASYIIFLLPPYFKNDGKRLTKSPKIYFFDTGLVTYLTHIYSEEAFEHGPLTGALFENYIIAEIYKHELLNPTHKQLCYWRTSHGEEVDLIIERFNYKEVIEIKSGQTLKSTMLKSMKMILDRQDKGYFIYRGETIPYDPQISILSYTEYLNFDNKEPIATTN